MTQEQELSTEKLWQEYCDAARSTGELPGGVEEFDIDEMNNRAWDLYEHAKALSQQLEKAREVKPLPWLRAADGFYRAEYEKGHFYEVVSVGRGRWIATNVVHGLGRRIGVLTHQTASAAKKSCQADYQRRYNAMSQEGE